MTIWYLMTIWKNSKEADFSLWLRWTLNDLQHLCSICKIELKTQTVFISDMVQQNSRHAVLHNFVQRISTWNPTFLLNVNLKCNPVLKNCGSLHHFYMFWKTLYNYLCTKKNVYIIIFFFNKNMLSIERKVYIKYGMVTSLN
jgi:hypothetical protein